MATKETSMMTSDVATIDTSPAAPRWTIPSFRRNPGRYPLGTEAVNQNLLAQELASGLPVLSRHPRYWSFYTFVIKQFWDQNRQPQNNSALGRFLRPREVAFASAALRCTQHGDVEFPNILGRNTFVPWFLANPFADIPLDMKYLEQSLGGYGQVYRGALQDLGLVLGAENNREAPLDAPFAEWGAAVAEAFGAAIAGTTYAKRYLTQDSGTIPFEVVRELGEASCFCRLTASVAERDLLTDILLGRLQRPHHTHTNRAATVRMFLDLAAATASTGLGDDGFRQVLYYGRTKAGAAWQPSPVVTPIWRRWWLIQHREFVVAALNTLFIHFVRWGIDSGGMLRPVGLDRYRTRIEQMRLPDLVGLPQGLAAAVPLREVVDALDVLVRRDGWPLGPGAVADPVSEVELLRQAEQGRAEGAPLVAMLAMLLAHRRVAFRREAGDLSAIDEQMLASGGFERVASRELGSWVERSLEAGHSLAEATLTFVRALVIRQHLRIARGKLPEDTFRFHEELGGYQFVNHQDHGIQPISIRYDSVSTALHGLGLIAAPLSAPEHGPTPRGQEVLNGR